MNVTLNNEKRGIEVRFDAKPAANVIAALKSNGFRWSARQKMWYAKRDDSRLAFINGLDSGIPAVSAPVSAPAVVDLWELTRTDGIEDNFAKFHIYNTKEIAATVRKHIKARFPFCRWSVRSDRNSIDTYLLGGLFPADSDETKAIVHYAYTFIQSYNYDHSDAMSDYFDRNFYGSYESSIVGYDYKQDEITDTARAMSEQFRAAKAAYELEQAAVRKAEAEAAARQAEIDRENSARIAAERAANVTEIEANHTVSDCDYFVNNVDGSKLNKLDSVNEIAAYAEHYRENCRVTREVHMSAAIYEKFSNQLMDDYSFLSGMGGSSTNDRRIQSPVDYDNMSEHERETVEWYCDDCVAVFADGVMKLVIDPQGFSYARYAFIVDVNSYKLDTYEGNTGISEDEYNENKAAADVLEDVSAEIIINNDISDTWETSDYPIWSSLMTDWILNHGARFDVGVARAVDGEMRSLKCAIYRLLTTVDGIGEQFKRAELMPGQRVTICRTSGFGWMQVWPVTIDSVEFGKYAQYDDAVKLVFHQPGKRGQYYNWFYGDILVYDGWCNVPNSVFWKESERENGVKVSMSRFMSCDKGQYDAILDYFKAQNIRPIINTYKPLF